jgi:predicted permease
MNDLRHAFRQLLKNPGFTAVAMLTLALGIGANTSLFTALDTILLRPLRAPEASRLLYVASGSSENFSFPFYERLRNAAGAFSGFAAVQYGAARRELIATAVGAAEAESVPAQAVTGNFFAVLDVPPLLGRTLSVDDDRPGAAQPVVVISHAFWQRRFAADPAVLGKGIQLDDVPVTIAGVMPAGFAGFEIGANPDVWFPLQLVTQLGQRVTQMGARAPSRLAEGVEWLVLFGRLRSGVTREQAQAEVSVILRQQLEEQVARSPTLTPGERQRMLNQTIELHSGAAGYVGARSRFKQPLVVLMAAVGVVLLIACTNVAGLLLARGAARQHELAVRAALGAGRGRIVRQLATESVLLGAMAGVLGLVFAQWGTRFLAAYLTQSDTAVVLELDGRVLLFTIAVSLLSGVLFGLVPALRLSRLDLVTAIKHRPASGGARPRLQPALVVAQVALSVLLLAGAGLFVRTLHNLRTLDLGFQPDNLLSLSLDPGRWRPASPGQLNTLLQRVLGELETLPGVRSVSVGGAGMLTGNGYNTLFTVDGYSPAPDEEMRAAVIFAGPRFFETLRVPLLRGREFTLADEPAPGPDDAPRPVTVAILGETMARRFFGEADPIGRHITLTRGLLNNVRLEVIGVAKDTKYSRNLREKTPLEFYVPFFGGGVRMPPTVYVRGEHSAATIAGDIRRAVTRIEPLVTIRYLRTMDEAVDRLLVRERIIAQLVGFFSGFALLLASLGVYGLLSYSVAQRTREIGVRLALGATLRDVVGLVIRQGLTLALFGCALGVAAALAVTRFIATLLYGVQPTDPFTFAAVTGLLVTVAWTACWLPARRAAKVDPMEALRYE